MELQLDLTQTFMELLKGNVEVEEHAPVYVILGKWCMFNNISVSSTSDRISEGCHRPALRVLGERPVVIP
jgi:hypothetical protein